MCRYEYVFEAIDNSFERFLEDNDYLYDPNEEQDTLVEYWDELQEELEFVD